jgi:small-conductance mechanosensitive channel
MLQWLFDRFGWLVWTLGLVTVAAVVGWVVQAILFVVGGKLTSRTTSVLDDSLLKRTRRPSRLLLPLLAVLSVVPLLELPDNAVSGVRHALGIATIAVVAWLVVSLTLTADDLVEARYPLDVADNLHARQIQTQVRLLRRVVAAFIVFIALAMILMTFPEIRQLGASLLASAGLAGLVVGMAARPTLANLVAGVQLALTQPIRIDDVVIVEGEWGRIEQIRATFVVVRIWDLRRLIVPLSYFIEHPLENWTRESADLLGTVFLHADYRVSVPAVREKLHEVLEASGMWDGKVWGLQVTEATPRDLELRAVMSAPDSGTAWNLRCHVRERLIRFLQEEHPEVLPRARAEIYGDSLSPPSTSDRR